MRETFFERARKDLETYDSQIRRYGEAKSAVEWIKAAIATEDDYLKLAKVYLNSLFYLNDKECGPELVKLILHTLNDISQGKIETGNFKFNPTEMTSTNTTGTWIGLFLVGVVAIGLIVVMIGLFYGVYNPGTWTKNKRNKKNIQKAKNKTQQPTFPNPQTPKKGVPNNSPNLLTEHRKNNSSNFAQKAEILISSKVNRKGFSKLPNDYLAALLHLPEDLMPGEAVDDGGCFFDSLAQTLNVLSSSEKHTEKSLRQACHLYYKKNKVTVDEWNKKDYGGVDKGDEYCFIKYTCAELDMDFNGRPPVWGRPHIEGVMICDALKLPAIYVIELLENPEDTQKPIPTYTRVTKEGVVTLEEKTFVYPESEPILIVEQKSLHFIPILSKEKNTHNFAQKSEILISSKINEIPTEELTFKEELGEGNFAKAYAGQWHTLPVAIKKPKAQNISPKEADDFKKEIALLGRLNSPYVVRLYGGNTGALPVMVMEHCTGGSLDKRLLQGHFIDWPQREKWAYEIAAGLAYLHSKNILHCDIACRNVLLDEKSTAKLADFGLSKVKRYDEDNRTLIPSVEYTGGDVSIWWAAPEFLEGERKNIFTFKTDMFSYGILLWEIASHGQTPLNEIREYLDGLFKQMQPSPSDEEKAAKIIEIIVQKVVHEKYRDGMPNLTSRVLGQMMEECREANPEKRPEAREVVKYFRQHSSIFSQPATAPEQPYVQMNYDPNPPAASNSTGQSSSVKNNTRPGFNG